MSGRRSYARFALSPSVEGVLRVLRDVVIQRADDHEIVAISREGGVLDETMVIQMADDEAAVPLRVRVVDSRPVVVDGIVRHRLRLRTLGAAIADSASPA